MNFENRYRNQIGSTPTHLFLRPHPLLRPFIAHYTLMLPGESQTPGFFHLIPDLSGCLVFTFDPCGMDGRLYGATTRMVIVNNDTNRHLLRLFVEFVPGGLSYFPGSSQSELADRVMEVSELCLELEQDMEAAFLQTADLDCFIQAVDKKLLRRMGEQEGSAALSDALARIKHTGGNISVKQLSKEVGYSERHLNRLFSERIGVSTKTFSRILRINRAVAMIKSRPMDFTMLAQETGYYDQSHLIRDFKRTCGATPGEVLQSLSVFYNEPIKFTV